MSGIATETEDASSSVLFAIPALPIPSRSSRSIASRRRHHRHHEKTQSPGRPRSRPRSGQPRASRSRSRDEMLRRALPRRRAPARPRVPPDPSRRSPSTSSWIGCRAACSAFGPKSAAAVRELERYGTVPVRRSGRVGQKARRRRRQQRRVLVALEHQHVPLAQLDLPELPPGRAPARCIATTAAP